jgi:hypothetical protein
LIPNYFLINKAIVFRDCLTPTGEIGEIDGVHFFKIVLDEISTVRYDDKGIFVVQNKPAMIGEGEL